MLRMVHGFASTFWCNKSLRKTMSQALNPRTGTQSANETPLDHGSSRSPCTSMDQFKQLVISHEQSNERDSEHKKGEQVSTHSRLCANALHATPTSCCADRLAETKRVERETKER